MPLSTWNLEWLNHNSQRNYPLADDASGYDSTGTFQIPDDFLVQLDIPIHSAMDMDPAKFFIRQIVAASTGYSIIVSYQRSRWHSRRSLFPYSNCITYHRVQNV